MKRIFRPVLFVSIFVLLIAVFVLHETVSSNAAAYLMTERASSVAPVADTSVTPFFKQLIPKPSYLMQAGTTGASSLVGEWRFDEATGATAADASARAANGTLQNGPVWTGGRYRSGLRFDGVNDYVQVGAPPSLVMTNTMSISAWIYPTGTSAAGLGIIVCKEGEYEIARFYDGTIRWAIANSAPGWNFIDTGFVAPLNQWTHIALTYNNGQVKTYANGNLVQTYLGNGAIGDVATTMNDFRIGGRQAVDHYFMGSIDEVAVYNQTLAATDIQKLAQGSMPRNLALGKPATQSTTGWDSPASLAVDGNTDGDWYHGSVSHTNGDTPGWWQVDLGSVQQIQEVGVWMMTVCCSSHDNFDVKLSTDGANWTNYYVAGPIDQVSVPVNQAARYVRVQLRAAGYLALAEVQVWGLPGAVMPGVVQAENFDDGGEGISYHDLTAANEGGLYRTTAVDVSACVANDYVIGWNGSGEWTQYSINVLTSGNYNFQAVIGEESSGSLHVEIDGVDKTGAITIPNTGNWCALQTISKGPIFLSAGQHMMRVVTDNVGVVLDSFRLVAQSSAYNGTPATIPGTVQVEAFDNGAEGVAYHDNSPTNETGSTFRAPTGVDVWEAGIGYAQAGEWLTYTVNVATTGTYTVGASVGAPAAGGSIHIEVDGVDKTGPMAVPNTGGWNTYQTITKSGVQLTAGPHTMRLVLDTNSGNGYVANFDLINFTLTTPNAAAFVSQSVPASMTPGQLYNVSVTMQNTGSNTWTTAGPYYLGTQNPQDNSTWNVLRVMLPNSQPVPPSQQVTFTFPIRAPSTPGTYNFQMQMLQENVEWFGAKSQNVAVTVATANQPPKANAGASQTGMVGYPVQFTGDGSYDPDGTIAGYSWNFGDGQTASGSNPAHTYAAGGNYAVTLTVTDNAGATSTATVPVAVLETTQSSYLNNSRVPGTIQAEDFDSGGPEVAYHDDSLGNQGGSATYRADENVDIEDNTASGAGYAVGWARGGEWLEYVVRVPDTDNYNFEARVAPPIDGGTGGVFHLEVDGGNKTGPITVPGTGNVWTTVSKAGIRIAAGTHVLRIVMESGGSTGYVGRFDYFKFTPTQTPYGGTARALPGTVQAEDFDNGEAGTSYSDTTAGNQGGAYRSTDVDIWNSSEGAAIGWTQKGEWWDYTVDVSQYTSYTFAVRVASPGAGAKFHLEIDEYVATDPIAVPATGSRDTWQTIQTSVKLTTGRHIVRLVVDDPGAGGEVCFNSFTVSIPPKDPSKVPAAEAVEVGGETYTNVDYTAYGVSDLRFNSPHSDNGDFAVRNITNVKHAFLFWWGVPSALDSSKIFFANEEQPIFGTRIAPAWRGEFYPGAESWSYRADVTALVLKHGGNFTYHIKTTTCYGASLILIWDDGNQNNNRDISLYAWNDGNALFRRPDGYVDPQGWDTTLKDVNYNGAGAKVQLHVAGGQRQQDALLTFASINSGRQVVYPQPNGTFDPLFPDIFKGASVPPISTTPGGSTDGLWDIIDFDVTGILNNGLNKVRISADQGPDMLFLVLAVVNQPHPLPTVTITDDKADTNRRVSGNLAGTTQKALIGAQISLRANGTTSGDKYHWDLTGPVTFVDGADTRTVTFETDDGNDKTVPKKNIYTVTAKVTFTNDVGAKTEASVTINVHVPTLPDFRGTASANTVEDDPDALFDNSFIIWQMGSSDPENRQPAMTFRATSQIPDGQYLSNLEHSRITFQQAINVLRKVRDSWGKESCKTTRLPFQTTPENTIRSGWRRDDDSFPHRVSQFQGATKNFGESTAVTNNNRSLLINFQEGVEGIKFHNKQGGSNDIEERDDKLGYELIDVDAAQVDDRYETYVMYSAGSFSRPLGTVSWKWSATMYFDTSWQRDLGPIDPPYSHLPPTNPVSEYYRFRNNTTSSGTILQAATDTVVAGSVLDPQNPPFKWTQCAEGFGKPQPTSDFNKLIIENQHGFVQLLYKEALGRSPFDADLRPSLEIPSGDRKGFHFWASNMTRNDFNDNAIDGYRVHVALAFMWADDLKDLHTADGDPLQGLNASSKHSPEYYRSFIWALYKVLLQRNPGERGRFTDGDTPGDMSGLNFWVEKLTREDAMRTDDEDTQAFFEAVHAFLACQEYFDRIKRDPLLNDFKDLIPDDFNHPAPIFVGPLP